MKTLKYYIRKSIHSTVALATLGLYSTVAPAATVDAIYNAATDVPVTANGYTATGNTVNFTLYFAPTTGTDLMVVSNTALPFINGTFDNLAQGQPVALSYGGSTYRFVANYYGGSGNDLVLVWANTRAFAWGYNNYGQLGDNTLTNRLLPVSVMASGVLAGKTVIALGESGAHSVALCSDGTVAAWGLNSSGALGNATTNNSLMPVAVNTNSGVSALYGKRVVAIGVASQSLALCSDGTVAAWGGNYKGALGDNTATDRNVPVAVNTAPDVSALFGKTVVAVAAGSGHSLALCSDGIVAAWGANDYGEIGDNTTTQRNAPVAVNTNSGVSALYGKTVVAIAGGGYHSLALCSDGTLVAWGCGLYGALGDNTTVNRYVPVAVNTSSGVSALYGKSVIAIAAGVNHSLALCSDGTVTAWGWNAFGQLGDNTTTLRKVPVAVNSSPGVSALYGKTAVAIASGAYQCLVLCSDGTVAGWGYNATGDLGDNTTTQRNAPVPVNTTPLAASQCFSRIFSGPPAFHSLALVAAPAAARVTLTSVRKLTDGSFQAAFTNTPGAFFGVLATTNPALPLCKWTPLGDATEVSPGQFQFTDPQASNTPSCFYRVRSP